MHGPASREAAITLVQDIFPAADVTWERLPRNKLERVSISSLLGKATKGVEVANVLQRDVIADLQYVFAPDKGKGIAYLRKRLELFRDVLDDTSA